MNPKPDAETRYRDLTDAEEVTVLEQWADRIGKMALDMCITWAHQGARPCGSCSRNVMWTTQQWSKLLLEDQKEEVRLEQVGSRGFYLKYSHALRVSAGHLEPYYRLAVDIDGEGKVL